MKYILLIILIGIVSIGVFVFISRQPQEQKEEVPTAWEDSLGQLLIIGFEGTELTPQLISLMEEIKPGGVLLLSRNIENKVQLTKLIGDLQGISLRTTGLPLFVAVDQEGEALSRIPFARDAQDLKELGINMNLAPVLDSRNPGDFLYERFLQHGSTQEAAQNFIEEHQTQGILAVPKHFPGYDRVLFNPEITIIPEVSQTPDTMLFEQVLQEKSVPFVMVSHVVYKDRDPENVFPFSAKSISWLHEKLGQETLVMSDDILSLAFLREFSYEEIGRKALEAGVDFMVAVGYPNAKVVPEFYRVTLELVRADTALQELVKERTGKVIELKQEVIE